MRWKGDDLRRSLAGRASGDVGAHCHGFDLGGGVGSVNQTHAAMAVGQDVVQELASLARKILDFEAAGTHPASVV